MDDNEGFSKVSYDVNLRSAPSGEAPAPDSTQVVVEIGPFGVTIYPNPTKGTLAIAVTGLAESELLSLGLYDPNGRPSRFKLRESHNDRDTKP